MIIEMFIQLRRFCNQLRQQEGVVPQSAAGRGFPQRERKEFERYFIAARVRNNSLSHCRKNTMNTKPISPKTHALIDYALAGSLLILPSLLRMNKTAKLVYAAEAAVLLPYVAMTKQPAALQGLIPFKTHGRIDPFNVAQFALQSFFGPFRKSRKTLVFNLAFTALAGITVLLTDWNGRTEKRG